MIYILQSKVDMEYAYLVRADNKDEARKILAFENEPHRIWCLEDFDESKLSANAHAIRLQCNP